MKILKMTALILAFSLLTAFFSEFGGEKKESGENGGVYVISEENNSYLGFAEGKALIEGVSVSAKSALLCTADGMLLYQKQADIPLPMASITKVMTAIVVLENTADISEKVEVSKEAVGTEGSSAYLKAGEKISKETLLYALLLESANDAAVELSVSVGGTSDGFVKMMNEKAASLSMTSTSFKNPHGLYEDGHYTTARDYAKLMAYALKNETFVKIISTKKAVFQSDDKSSTRVFVNHNRLLNTYRYMIGGKTGYTQASGRTLVTAAKKNGSTLICITLNASDDWNDHVSLFEAGFDKISSEEFCPETLKITLDVGGGVSGNVCALPKEKITVTTEKGEMTETEYFVPKFLFAPVYAGDEIGYVKIKSRGQTLATVPLYAENGVEVRNETEKNGLLGKLKLLADRSKGK